MLCFRNSWFPWRAWPQGYRTSGALRACQLPGGVEGAGQHSKEENRSLLPFPV
jgi:hypothetical protein